jgi:hypothetical protein
MRYSEFKPYKRLFEFAAPKGKEDIVSDLESILNSVDPSTPEYLEAIDLLQQIVIAGSPEPVEPEPVEPEPVEPEPMVAQEPPAEELVEPEVAPEEPALAEAQSSVTGLVTKARKAQKALSYDETLALRKQIRALESRVAELEIEKEKYGKKEFNRGQKKEFATNKKAFTNIATLALKLTRKVSGSLDSIKKAYDEQIARGDYIKLEDGTEIEAPIRTNPKKVTTEVKQDLLDVITDMFSRPLGAAETIADRNRREKALSNFMLKCIDGIVDFPTLLEAKRGNVLLDVSTEEQEVIDMIGNLLLVKPSSTAGNWGPGELGLAILGNPVKKGKTGDLVVNGKDIELKASQNPEKGGRLGTVALNKGDQGYSVYERALKSLFASAGYKPDELNYSLKKKDEVSEARVKKVKELKKSILPSNNVGVYTDERGNEKDIKWTSFGRTFIENALNPKIKDRVGIKTTEEFLRTVATSCLVERYKKKAGGEWDTSFVEGCVDTDGTISYDAFATGYAKMLYDLYQVVDGKGEIMVLNPLTGSYYVMLSSLDFDEATTAGQGYQHIQVSSVAIDFTDSQGKASPQIGIA